MDRSKYYFYVLLCGDNSFYGGFTTDVWARLKKHQAGQGAKYTRSHQPVSLLYYQAFSSKSAALKAEYAFKHQSRKQKEAYLLARGVKDWSHKDAST